jgi:hypothetical protein
MWQARHLSKIRRPNTQSLTHLSRGRSTGRGRRPPTRRKKIAITTKTQTEPSLGSSSGSGASSAGGDLAGESASPRQPRVIRNLGGPGVLAFNPAAVKLKKFTPRRAAAPTKPPSNPFASVSLRKTPNSAPFNAATQALQPAPVTRLRGATGGAQMRRPVSQPLGTVIALGNSLSVVLLLLFLFGRVALLSLPDAYSHSLPLSPLILFLTPRPSSSLLPPRVSPLRSLIHYTLRTSTLLRCTSATQSR